MEALESLVQKRLTVVAFWSDGGHTHGALRHVAPSQGRAPKSYTFTEDKGSRFTAG
jgi:hypothetical protein